jgi:hypothetical protein
MLMKLQGQDKVPTPNLAGEEDPEDSGVKAVNFRTEPFWTRLQYPAETPLTTTRTFDFHDVVSNALVGADPQTPVFTAQSGTPVRFRLLMAGGHSRNIVFALHGHGWQKEPWVGDSTLQGSNSRSPLEGAHMGIGPTDHFNLLVNAGGAFQVEGDYLFRDMASFGFDGGLWGIFRVVP